MVKPILNNAITTINLRRQASIPIFFTCHCHKSPADGSMHREWWDNYLILDDTVDSELFPEIGRCRNLMRWSRRTRTAGF
ncbi:hypothetical protein GOBAR_DD26637 [Gossypium barbadense]|nr:hypothetical protein GOBAR_DD26637 [Gossypium barbadense]